MSVVGLLAAPKQGSNWTGTHRNGVPVLFFKTGTAFRFIFLKIQNENDGGSHVPEDLAELNAAIDTIPITSADADRKSVV